MLAARQDQRPLREPFERKLLGKCSRPCAANKDQLLVEQCALAQAALGLVAEQDREIQASGLEPFLQEAAVGLDNLQADLRQPLAAGAKDGQSRTERHSGGQPDRHAAARHRSRFAHGQRGALDICQHELRVLEEGLARRGRGYALVGAQQQAHAELLFERRYLLP